MRCTVIRRSREWNMHLNRKTVVQWIKAVALLGVAMLAPLVNLAQAQADPPGRVGRLADFQGTVWVFEHEAGDWAAALRNRPLTSGDRISTGPGARAELRIGSTVVRIGARSELELVQLDDQGMRMQLHSGSAALRVRSREVAEEIEWVTAEVRLRPMRAGHFRLDRQDDITFAAALSGELLVDESTAFPIAAGQRMDLWREGLQRQLRHRWSTMPQDAMSAWLSREDQQEQRSASSRYVSPEMTGAEDLDRHGRWENHPEYGSLWVPIGVQLGWAPYRFGTWVWLRPWGWSWVDAQPWGFAPFHYGRWVSVRGRWCWAPGAYAHRPIYAPALVSWVGGPQHGVSAGVVIGHRARPLPAAGWVPLSPREDYRPHYGASPVYVERINRGHGPHDSYDGRDSRDGRDGRGTREPHPRAIMPAPAALQMPAAPPGPRIPTLMPPIPAVQPPLPTPRPDLPYPGAPHAGTPQLGAVQPGQPRVHLPRHGPLSPAAGVAPGVAGPGATLPAAVPPVVLLPPPRPRQDQPRGPAKEPDGARPAGRDDAPRAKALESRPGPRDRERENQR